jgi:hypothetical protein
MGMIQPVNGDDYHFNLLILMGFLLPKTLKLLKSVKTLKTTTAKRELAPLGTPSRQEHEGACPFIPPWNHRRFLIPKKEDVSEVLVCYSLGVYESQSNPQRNRVTR